VNLSEENHRQLWIPPGYAHGFVVLSEVADFEYKCTDYYNAGAEVGVIWNDPDIGIDWPIRDPQLSPKDLALPTLAQIRARQ
jgi:dTDP-4-dehydrorhamnose 3,5-epimerase